MTSPSSADPPPDLSFDRASRLIGEARSHLAGAMLAHPDAHACAELRRIDVALVSLEQHAAASAVELGSVPEGCTTRGASWDSIELRRCSICGCATHRRSVVGRTVWAICYACAGRLEPA